MVFGALLFRPVLGRGPSGQVGAVESGTCSRHRGIRHQVSHNQKPGRGRLVRDDPNQK